LKIKLKKSYIYIIISVVVVLAVLSVYFFVFYSKTVAVVDGIKIKQKEVDIYVDLLKKQDTTGELASDEEQLKTLESSVIDSLIVFRLFEEYAEENDIAVTDEEVDEQIKSIVDSYESEDKFNEALKENGMSKEFFEVYMKRQLISNKIYDKVTSGIAVTDGEVEKYYEDNRETAFLVPESLKAGHILAMFPWKKDNSGETEEGREEAKEKIEIVEEKLKNGADFEELARQYSDDTSTAENGGDLGYISKGQMVEEFDKALFSLDIGEVSDIVETEYGFHIIKVYDRAEEYIQEFNEVKELISSYLLSLYEESKWEDFVYSLIEAADIEYLTDVEGTLNSLDTGDESE
jgi:foldase protein PrsA